MEDKSSNTQKKKDFSPHISSFKLISSVAKISSVNYCPYYYYYKY